MMKSLFVANLALEETEGIFKKIKAQTESIGKNTGECRLVVREGKGTKIYNSDWKKTEYINKSVCRVVRDLLRQEEYDFVYIRHMIPNVFLFLMLMLARKKHIKIFYEIPTYPYFGEQYKAAQKKYRAIVKITLDIVLGPLIYFLSDVIVVIKSNSNVHMFKKMTEITNGVYTENIECKKHRENDKNVFRMVAVGTIYPYHGYDRILKGLAQCNEKIGDVEVEVHFVGQSNTMIRLQEYAKELKLKKAFFHGVKTTKELNEMYDKFDVGLGCLALHRRNADIDTTLKIIEYYCRGIPVVTSGISPMDSVNDKYTVHVTDEETAIDIEKIYWEFKKITDEDKRNIAYEARKVFSWDVIMQKLLNLYVE